MSTLNYPGAAATRDARNRAARTFMIGAATDVAGSAALAVLPMLAGADLPGLRSTGRRSGCSPRRRRRPPRCRTWPG
jgi:hypothetical protein